MESLNLLKQPLEADPNIWLLSIGLGFLVGLQRQWAEEPLAGIRTFSLVSLLGTAAAYLSTIFGFGVLLIAFFCVIVAMAVGHLTTNLKTQEPKHIKSGLSTEISLAITFFVGVITLTGPRWLAMAIAGATAVILQAKLELHGLAARFSGKEIKAIMQFVLITLVILPVIPNETFGPLNVINPHEVWLMVIFIVGISLGGYIAYKFLGDRAGIWVSGFLGGVISSTATTVTCARTSKSSPISSSAQALIVTLAWSVVYVRVALEILAVAPLFFRTISLPLGILLFICLISIFWSKKHAKKANLDMPAHANPSELKTALAFAITYAIVVFAVAFAKKYFGDKGLLVVAMLSGITDMDAITLSTARHVSTGTLGPQEAWPLIFMAIISNLFFKGGIIWLLGDRQLKRLTLLPWLTQVITALGLLFFL